MDYVSNIVVSRKCSHQPTLGFKRLNIQWYFLILLGNLCLTSKTIDFSVLTLWVPSGSNVIPWPGTKTTVRVHNRTTRSGWFLYKMIYLLNQMDFPLHIPCHLLSPWFFFLVCNSSTKGLGRPPLALPIWRSRDARSHSPYTLTAEATRSWPGEWLWWYKLAITKYWYRFKNHITPCNKPQAYDEWIWYDVMWCDVMWCDVMWCDVMWCDVMWCDAMRCDAMRCDVMWCDVMWCDVTWYDMMTWHDMTWHDMTWYDVIWYDMIWIVRCWKTYLSIGCDSESIMPEMKNLNKWHSVSHPNVSITPKWAGRWPH